MADHAALEHGVAHHESLAGRCIIVTRAGVQGEMLSERLTQLGATPIHCPSIAFVAPQTFEPLDDALDQLGHFAWMVFTSANAVHAVADRMRTRHGCVSANVPHIATVGRATTAAVMAEGWNVAFTPERNSGEGVAETLPFVAGDCVLLPRADLASHDVPGILRARGATVTEVVAYRTVADPEVARVVQLVADGGVDALTFTSPSTVAFFMEGAAAAGCDVSAARHQANTAVVCIGPTTAHTALELGLAPDAVATEQSMHGLVEALSMCLSTRPRKRTSWRTA